MLLRKNSKYIDNSLFKYLVVGALNTFIGLFIIYMLKWFLAVGDIASNLIGYSIGITLSFVLNKKWTFRHKGATIQTLFRFLIVILAAYFSNLYTVIILIDAYSVNTYIAQASGIIPYTLVGYIGSKLFAFKNRL